jgi:hypothetical protein
MGLVELAEQKRAAREAAAAEANWRRRLAAAEAELAAAVDVFLEAEALKQRRNAAVYAALTAPGAVQDNQSMYVSGQVPAGEPGAPARVEAAKARHAAAVDDANQANAIVGRWAAERDTCLRAIDSCRAAQQQAGATVERLERERAAELAAV